MDDIILGIKSTAIKFGDNTKLYLSGFGAAMIASLIASGVVTAQMWPYYTAVGIIAMHISSQVNYSGKSFATEFTIIVFSNENTSVFLQIYTLNINNPTDCAKKFVSNHRIGMILFSGIVLGNLMKKSLMEEESEAKTQSKRQIAALDTNKNHL